MSEQSERRDKVWRMLDIVLAIVLTSGMGVLGYQQQVLMAHGEQLAAIAASRFDSSDGLEVWKEIAALRQDIAVLPREVPPKWFVEKVDKLELALEKISAKLSELDRELDKTRNNGK